MKVRFSPLARDDLMEIAVYIAEDRPQRALSFVRIERILHSARNIGAGDLIPQADDGH